MQKELIKLDEIIWEICGNCKNGCSYCGSKDNWNTPIDENKIKTIADKIVEHKGINSVNVSGGDPLLVSLKTHSYIVYKFTENNIESKILINPRSFRLESNKVNKYEILNIYDWVGISINEQCEIDYFNEHLSDWVKTNNCATIITNFNVINVFNFEKIKQIVKKFNMCWQIQYTMYSDPKDANALYNSDEANKYFYERINSALQEGIKIVVADNMNDGSCGAGKNSIGILFDGSVIPCLSMRSWVSDINSITQGNIITTSLTYIWENMFGKYRFCEYKCCKDHCNNKCFKRLNVPETFKPLLPIFPTTIKEISDGISLYGVKIDKTIVYGVKKDRNVDTPSITVYAVFSEGYNNTEGTMT